MKVFKIILIAVVAIIAVFLIIPLFLSPTYLVSRSIEIDKPANVVFEKTADYSLRKNWDPWMEMDTDAENSFEVKEGFVGSVWSWSGDTVGTGSMEIVMAEPAKAIKSKLKFTAPWESESMVAWKFTEIDSNKTDVEWSNTGELPYLMRYMSSGMDKMLGPQLEKGLNNLKTYVEAPADTMKGMEDKK